ncbi:MAG: sigma-70 family RNA polymerase sigma factor [Thiobacillus sp.]|nr:sigma-70 family RNA polymerase sigma factor [Thiobacillus sp.]
MPANEDDFDYESALLACARGEVFAFESLYRRESRWLGGVAYRILRDRALAEEALHDAFLQIWQKAHTFDRNLGSARGWIYTVVRHRALGMARGLGRETAAGDMAALSDIRGEPVQPNDGRDDAADIDKCLEDLPPERRESILLAFLDGYSHEEIARALKTPLGTVKSWIRRGLASLKECLS